MRTNTRLSARACLSAWACLGWAATGVLAQPANDLCANRIPVGIPSSTTGTTTLATLDTVPICVTTVTAPGVWYSVTGTGNTIIATTCGPLPGYDTKISVYTGGCAALVCVSDNDDDCTGGASGLFSTVSWASAAGTEYLILVHGFSSATGVFVLDISECNVVCDPNATPENEPDCGLPVDTVNGGCNSSPQAFGTIQCGETVCGTSGAAGGTRDTDWYILDLTGAGGDTQVTIDVDPEFAALTGFVENCGIPDCNATTGAINPFATGPECQLVSVTTCLAPGTYLVFVAQSDFADLACGAKYELTVTCQPCVTDRGACCLPSGVCVEDLTQCDCEFAFPFGQGGIWQGVGTDCVINPCPAPVLCPCGVPISTFPYSEDFEAEPTCVTTCNTACPLIGGWTNLITFGDDIDWTIDEGGTISGGTGPAIDANPGTATGNYAYTESSLPCVDSQAVLFSPCFDISNLMNPTFSFAYHMFGDDMGDLLVEVSTDDCLSWTTELTLSGQQHAAQPDPWLTAFVDLSGYSGATNLRIRFLGITGPGFESDMAIDDIRLREGGMGACCSGPGGACQVIAEATCAAQGGTFLGAGTDCADPLVCDRGACCTPAGCIDGELLADCQNAGGIFQGALTFCTPDPCPALCPCGAPVNAFPYGQNFEGEVQCGTICGNACILLGDWTNVTDGSDDFDWTSDSGGTGSIGTGPEIDANPGTAAGIYLYTETSGAACQNATAILLSPCLDISGLMMNPTFSFAYHMFGADIVSLNVDVSDNDCFSWTNELSILGPQQMANADPWISAFVDLSPYAASTNLRIRIRGETGGGLESDMAIDDIQLLSGGSGACCFGPTNCVELSVAGCVTQGGAFLGGGTDCTNPAVCDIGACCETSTGQCLGDMSMAACLAQPDRTWHFLESCATFTCPQPVPINDECTGAIPVTLGLPVQFNNTASTPDINEGLTCGTSITTVRTMWYSVMGTGNTMTASTCTGVAGFTEIDTVLRVFCGDCQNPTCVGGDDDGPLPGCDLPVNPFAGSEFSWCSQAGVEYLIVVGAFGPTANPTQGNIQLTVSDDGVPCVATIQCLPQGACCVGSTCSVTTQVGCTATGGSYQGDGTDCGVFTYTPVIGANALEDISATGTIAPIASTSDDAGDIIPLPFTFNFYGLPQAAVGVASNGYLTFGPDVSDLSNDPIPSTLDPNDAIFPYWDDWSPNQGGDVRTQTLGVAPNRRFIAQWTNVPHFGGTGPSTFQAVLFEGTDCVEFRYGPLSPNSPTVGVENPDGTAGVAAPAPAGLGVSFEFCPLLPPNPCAGPGGCATCPGDVSGDGVLDGLDIVGSVGCMLDPANGPGITPTVGCECSDVDGLLGVTPDDISDFVTILLTGGPCP